MSLLGVRQHLCSFFFLSLLSCNGGFYLCYIAECHYHLVSTEQIRKLKEKNKSPSVHINVSEN